MPFVWLLRVRTPVMCELPRSGRVIVLVLVVESVSSPVVPEVGVVSCGFGHPDGNESSMFAMGGDAVGMCVEKVLSN